MVDKRRCAFLNHISFPGGLQIALKKLLKCEVSNLTYFLRPEKFDTIVHATKELCVNQVCSQKRPEFEMPSLALKMGYALKKCASIERGAALKRMDLNTDEVLKSFLKLMELEWATRISSNALSTLYKRKINQPQLLPLTSDIIKINEFINVNIHKYRIELEQSLSAEKWQSLAYITLARIILFNKRRSGEAARMTLENYTTRPSWTDQSTQETKHSLTPFEKKLADRVALIEI